MPDFKVGQTVLLFPGGGRGGITEHEVTKVGTKRVYIKLWGKERPFSIETGKDSTHTSSTPGPAMYIKTEQQVAEANERSNVIADLKKLGIVSDGYSSFTYSTTLLNKIVNLILEETK